MPRNAPPEQPEWKRIAQWPETAEDYLQLVDGTGDFCKNLFTKERLRFEILHLDSDSREIRIACQHDELFQVDIDTWGWIGLGGTWTRRVIGCLGPDARHSGNGPVFGPEDTGNKFDECQVDFPKERLLGVAKVVGARKRPLRNPKGNASSIHGP